MTFDMPARLAGARLLLPLGLCVLIASPSECEGRALRDPVEGSIFGVGYAALEPPGLAPLWAKTGIRTIKLANAQWQFIEPVKPRKVRGKSVHRYRWQLSDKMVKEFQAHGFGLQIILRAKSRWAGRKLTNRGLDVAGGGIATTLPKEAHMGDYADFVRAVVERYDGDGKADMPGLRFAILHYEFESEAQHAAAWQGTVQEYLRLLRTARKAARQANPRVKIILAGFDVGDIFDDIPDESTVRRRFASLGGRDRAFIETTLKATDAYDIIEIHYNRDYTGIFKQVQWIRRFSNKPIWAGDAASAPFLLASGSHFFNPLYPQGEAVRIFKKITAGDPSTTAWFRRKQSELAVKKIAAGAGAGLKKVMMELTGIWKRQAGMGGFHNNFAISNMLDENVRPLPVYRTLKLLVRKIDGFSRVERLKLGGRGIYAYRFDVRGSPVHILWYDDFKHQRPGEKEARRTVSLPIRGREARITGILTGMSQTSPKVRTRAVKNGAVRLSLTETPVIVEASGSPGGTPSEPPAPRPAPRPSPRPIPGTSPRPAPPPAPKPVRGQGAVGREMFFGGVRKQRYDGPATFQGRRYHRNFQVWGDPAARCDRSKGRFNPNGVSPELYCKGKAIWKFSRCRTGRCRGACKPRCGWKGVDRCDDRLAHICRGGHRCLLVSPGEAWCVK